MKRGIAGLILLWGSLAAVPTAAETPALPRENSRLCVFPYVWTLTPEDAAGRAERLWGRLPLDSRLYECTDDLQTDLLLTDPEGVEIPFRIQTETAPQDGGRESPVPGKITGITQYPDGRTAIEYTLDTTAEVGGIELVRDNRPFRYTLSVNVHNRNRWESALAGYTLTDCPGFPEPVRRRLTFSRAYRTDKLRIIIGSRNADGATASAPEKKDPAAETGIAYAGNVGFESIRAIAVEHYRLQESPVRVEYDLTLLKRTPLEDREVLLLGARREPLTALRIFYPEPRYQRRVEIAGSDDGKNWVLLTGGTLRKLDSEQLVFIEFPVSRYRLYRLNVIFEDGSRPANPPTIKAFGVRYHLAFSAPLPETLLLYCGGRLERTGNSEADVPPIQEKLGAPLCYGLGESRPNPAAAKSPQALPAVRYVFPLLILMGVLLLLLPLRRVLQRSGAWVPADSAPEKKD